MKDKIKFNEFIEIQSKLEIKTGKIIKVNEIHKSEKLIQLIVDFDEDELRSVVTNIKPILGDNFKEILENEIFLFVTNLEPVKMMGIDSTAMIIPGQLHDSKILKANQYGIVVI